MSCSGDSTTYGPQAAWSKKSDADWLAHAMSPPESTTDLKSAGSSIEIRSSSGALMGRVVYRTSDDGVTFGSWTVLNTSPTQVQTNDGTLYRPGFVDLASVVAGKQLIQWGVEIANSSGSATEMCAVVVKIERKRG